MVTDVKVLVDVMVPTGTRLLLSATSSKRFSFTYVVNGTVVAQDVDCGIPKTEAQKVLTSLEIAELAEKSPM